MNKIGYGTAAIGRPHYINIRQAASNAFNLDEFTKEGIEALQSAYDMGIRYFDTAPGYGIAESMIIQWLKESGVSDVEIATKWGYTYTANFDLHAEIHEVKAHSLSKLNEQWSVSENLLPPLTTYQIHSATFDSGVLENKEVHERLSELKSEYGLLIGLTTSGDNQLDILKRSLDIEVDGNQLFDVFQVTYNMLDQSLNKISVKLNAQNKRIVIKETLANGRIFPNTHFPHYRPLYNALNSLAMKYEVGVDAVALRYCIDSINPFIVLSGASHAEQIQENVKANDFVLTDEDIDLLNSFSVNPKAYWSERKKLVWN